MGKLSKKEQLKRMRLWYQQPDPQWVTGQWDRSGYRYADPKDYKRYGEGYGGYMLSCWYCKAKFLSYSKVRRYCSYRCNNDAYIEKRKLRQRKLRQKTCAYCGKAFEAKRRDAEYCSVNHRVLAYMKRRR